MSELLERARAIAQRGSPFELSDIGTLREAADATEFSMLNADDAKIDETLDTIFGTPWRLRWKLANDAPLSLTELEDAAALSRADAERLDAQSKLATRPEIRAILEQKRDAACERAVTLQQRRAQLDGDGIGSQTLGDTGIGE